MTDKSQELALAVLQEANVNGTLDPTIETALANLIATEARPELNGLLKNSTTAETPEAANLNQVMRAYQQEYESLPNDVKARANWEAIAERLMENDGEKLKLAQAMQGKGQLVGIDTEGKALFKDKGVEPVMYGFDGDGKLLQIYNREQNQMELVQRWANYFEIREQVLKDGYELFSDDGNSDFSDEMKQVIENTKKPFVASENRKEPRVTWLESGDKTDYASSVGFIPNSNNCNVVGDSPGYRNACCGASRLLKV